MTDWDESEIRAVFVAQAEAALALKRARAHAVIACVEAGMKEPELWAKVELETEAEAEEALYADALAKVLWAMVVKELGITRAMHEEAF